MIATLFFKYFYGLLNDRIIRNRDTLSDWFSKCIDIYLAKIKKNIYYVYKKK